MISKILLIIKIEEKLGKYSVLRSAKDTVSTLMLLGQMVIMFIFSLELRQDIRLQE